MRLTRGDVVAVAYGRTYHNAVVVQASTFIGFGATVIVCVPSCTSGCRPTRRSWRA